MRVYFIFDIKKQYINLYKDNKFVLFNILKGLYNYSYDDVEMGFNLFNQLTNKIEKDLVDRYLFNIRCFIILKVVLVKAKSFLNSLY